MTADDVMADAVKAAAEAPCDHEPDDYAPADRCRCGATFEGPRALLDLIEHVSWHRAEATVAAAAPILLAPVQAEVERLRAALALQAESVEAAEAREREAVPEVERLRVAVLTAYGMGRDDEAAGLPARTFRNSPDTTGVVPMSPNKGHERAEAVAALAAIRAICTDPKNLTAGGYVMVPAANILAHTVQP